MERTESASSHSSEKDSSTAQVESIVVLLAPEVDSQDGPSDAQRMDEPMYPTGVKRLTILLSLAIATFLVALVSSRAEIHCPN
jgi:hypothetical protein